MLCMDVAFFFLFSSFSTFAVFDIRESISSRRSILLTVINGGKKEDSFRNPKEKPIRRERIETFRFSERVEKKPWLRFSRIIIFILFVRVPLN